MANGGLIPIVTKNADVDIQDYGVSINELSVDAVIRSIKESQKLSLSQLKEQSGRIISETHQFNSFEYFKKDFKLKLQEAIKAI
jgi:hypothetical protein